MRSIAIVDDHPLMVEAIASLLAGHGDLTLVAVGKVAGDISAIAAAHQPDVIVVDLNMQGDVFEAMGHARAASPGSRIVVFTASLATDSAVKALEIGSTAYVLKGSASNEVLDAIDAVLRGEVYITPSFARRVIGALQSKALEKRANATVHLSVREDQIVGLLLCGKRNREIAVSLSLSEKTVKSYMGNLMQKLNAKSRLEVVIAAQKIAANAAAKLLI